MARDVEKAPPRPGAAGPTALVMADRREGPDLWGVAEAMQPLADLCLSPDAETPFALGLVGGRGAGKSFALRRLLEAIGERAGRPPALSRIVVAEVDAALGGDPASAVASAIYAALERDEGGASYAALADEASHAMVDPRHAATTAAERHDEIVGRLEQERRARDEVEQRRARLAEALLSETPGSRIDAFIRASHPAIEATLRRFGFGQGDADANFRGLVRDLAATRARSRLGLFLRAIWAYRGQARLIVLAILAFALAFGLDRLRQPAVQDAILSLSASLAPVTDAVKAHDEALGYLGEALAALGAAALALNLWRAARFTGLLFRGLRMLNLDIGERRRELDASAARLERRVASLQIEADSAQQRAEALARRAGAGQPTSRAPGPAFLAPVATSERAARAFHDELGRVMDAAATAAPQRIVVALDGLDALPPAEAQRFLETAVRVAARGTALIAAADLARLGDPRALAESLFEVVYDVEAPASAEALAGRLLSPGPALAEPKRAELTGPMDASEFADLKAACAWIGPRPRRLKRFYNAYRTARLADAPRAAVALSLAALMAPTPDLATALRAWLAGAGETPEVAAAFARVGLRDLDRAAGQRAFDAARRFAPWG